MKLKKSISIVLAMLIMLGAFVAAPISANAGMPTYFHPGIVTDSGYWYAWTWSDSEEGSWRTAYDEDGVITFYGLSDKVVFVLMSQQLDELDDMSWGYTVHQSDDLIVKGTHFTATKWTKHNENWDSDNFSGVWSDKEENVTGENPIKVTTSNKTLKASELKKSAKTVKPLNISKAVGSVKVEKVKDGTTSSIYGKITVDSKTGATTFKKSVYKAGTCKIKYKIIASGDENYKKKTVNKSVNIKIKGKDSNTVTVSAKSKDFKISKLKNSKTTVKLLSIKKAKGKVKVTKVKKGTTSSIFKMISVNRKTGAITLKKGSYKKGEYKIKLKVNAAGNNNYKSKTVSKTVNIRIANKYVKCSNCGGKGYFSCSTCGGSGLVYTGTTLTLYSYGVPYKTIRLTRKCDKCDGDGKIECPHCHGKKTMIK